MCTSIDIISKESSRRDLSETALFGVGTLLVVEQLSLESQSIMGCAKTPILTGRSTNLTSVSFSYVSYSLAQPIAEHIQKKNTEIIAAEMSKVLCFIFVFF